MLENAILLRNIMNHFDRGTDINTAISSVVPVLPFMENLSEADAMVKAETLVKFVYGQSTVKETFETVEQKPVKNEFVYEGLGKIVRDARINLSISITDLAAKAKVSESTITDIERSRSKNPSIETKKKLGKVLKINLLTVPEQFLSLSSASTIFNRIMNDLIVDVKEISTKAEISYESVSNFAKNKGTMSVENFTCSFSEYCPFLSFWKVVLLLRWREDE